DNYPRHLRIPASEEVQEAASIPCGAGRICGVVTCGSHCGLFDRRSGGPGGGAPGGSAPEGPCPGGLRLRPHGDRGRYCSICLPNLSRLFGRNLTGRVIKLALVLPVLTFKGSNPRFQSGYFFEDRVGRGLSG
ncbi:hypothetical protein, partial [Bradyrhizobium ottawaense]|uniref:hypothetical protein n=1 Tax=Bradyrhizobium ottawaense TaxID=931866 RepID=UPI0030C6A9EE